MRQWRRQFLSGSPEFCSKEVKFNGCHLCPEYNSILDSTQPTEIQERGPLRLGLNLNGHCNLECVMCNVWQYPNSLYDQLNMWPEIEKLVQHAEEVEFFSGEPFIQKDTYRVIDIIHKTASKCRVTFTTNGHWKLNDTIRSALDKIRIKHITVSLDSVNHETYPKIRRKGTLQVVLDNIQRLKDYQHSREQRGLESFKLKLSFAVQKNNWNELSDFHEYSQKIQIPLFKCFVYEPKECSLLTLPHEQRESVLDFYIENLTASIWSHSHRVTKPLLESISPLVRADKLLKIQKKLHGAF